MKFLWIIVQNLEKVIQLLKNIKKEKIILFRRLERSPFYKGNLLKPKLNLNQIFFQIGVKKKLQF